MMSRRGGSPDYLFLILLFVLVIFGFVMLTSASSDLAKIKFGDSYYYLKHQLLYGLTLGLLGFLCGVFVYYRTWEKFAIPLLLLNIILLILVLVTPLGSRVNGSERWIVIHGITFQPAELLKLTFLIYLASWISKKRARTKSFSEGFLPFVLITFFVLLLVVLQPATSIAMIIAAAAFVAYFISGAPMRYMLLGGVGILALLALLVFITPYRQSRIQTFLHPEENQEGSGYHINQALNAIGTGGLRGVGYGQSTTKLGILPEPTTDSIFAVIAEELGFIGSVSLVLVFLLFVVRGLVIAKSAPDVFGKLLAASFSSLIGLQVFVNVGALSGILPLTGLPLPFISYGGTALTVFLTMSGIIVNISKHR